ncbi:MAG: DUF5916 domain-containing protein [Gemmatimonadota bacterium]|nr:DUF5916 domain-containing protein [Gemmatimonadota bacterium]
MIRPVFALWLMMALAAPVRGAAAQSRAGVAILDSAAAAPVAVAQDDPEPEPKPRRRDGWVPPKTADAVPVPDEAIRVDGTLDDAAWASARWFSDFVQKDPVEGAPPSERTEMAFVYDGDNLYVGARMYASDPSVVSDAVSRRDDRGALADILIVSLDTYGDRRTAWSFGVTPAGTRHDWFHPSDTEHDRDNTFDPVWEARTRIGEDGWTAEMRIPFSQLRFVDAERQEWGFNVNRWIPARNEDIYWVPVPRDETGWASRFGALRGVEGISSGRRIELSPYVATEARFTSDALLDDADPFADAAEGRARVGADLKMGLGPNLTLDATVNPDFGQVDADPAFVNLTAFETVFEERRPFFTEGAQLLSGNGRRGPTYYYSRRIGAPPHVSPDAEFADVPEQTTIVGAGKVSGRLASGLSVGALAALTSSESARTFDPADDGAGPLPGAFDETRVEPPAGYGIVRLQQEFGPSSSTVGLTATAVRREFGRDDPTRLRLTRQAFSSGGDFLLRLGGGAYEVNGHFGLSRVEGAPEAIARIQQTSAHYFQRPDQDHVTLDSTRTSLTGASGSLQVAKREGSWLWSAGAWGDSPEWELNDAGLLRQADDFQTWANLSYRETDPGPTFRSWNVGVDGGTGWNFGGVRKQTRIGGFASATLANYWRLRLNGSYFAAAQDDRLTRGGPLMGKPAFGSVSASIANNFSSRTRWEVSGFWGNQDRGDDVRLEFELEVQPSSRMRLSVEPRFESFTNRRQFFGTVEREGADPADPAGTFGTRYLFSTVEQREFASPVRASYSFAPDVSLELWAEPFAASGEFSRFGELPEPRAFDLLEYGTGGTTIEETLDPETGESAFLVTDGAQEFTLEDADFTTVSFRSNLVLRWEVRPGSTLFVVWQQDLSDDRERRTDVRFGDMFDAFGAPGRNVIAVKLNWWMPV